MNKTLQMRHIRQRQADKHRVSLVLAFLCVLLVPILLPAIAADALLGAEQESPLFADSMSLACEVSHKARRPAPIPEDWDFVILSTGDIMMHSPQTKAGWVPESKTYDFAFMFEKIAPILHTGDLVIGNLETPLAGEANGGFTGYPMFNAPEKLARNLYEAGFTLVSTANNHSLDRRHQGLLTTLDHLDEAGLMHTGTYRSPDPGERILHFTVKGVRIAAIAATYGTNGLVLPQEFSYALQYIEEGQLLADISRARAEGARYVIVMLHWGVEYQHAPNKEQERLAHNLLHGGADLILGNHPHVLQRGEIVEIPGSGRSGFVMYSQGNLVSNQEGIDRLCSMLLRLTIGVDGGTGQPYLKEAGYIPIYTQKKDNRGISHHMVWPLEQAMEELDGGGQAFRGEDRANIPKAWELVLKSQPFLEPLSLRGLGIPDTTDGANPSLIPAGTMIE